MIKRFDPQVALLSVIDAGLVDLVRSPNGFLTKN